MLTPDALDKMSGRSRKINECMIDAHTYPAMLNVAASEIRGLDILVSTAATMLPTGPNHLKP